MLNYDAKYYSGLEDIWGKQNFILRPIYAFWYLFKVCSARRWRIKVVKQMIKAGGIQQWNLSKIKRY